MPDVPEITLRELAARYAVLLFDAYGVLVHATGPLPGAKGLVEALNRAGKPYYILTNDASQLPARTARRYRTYGLPVPPERIITSGLLLTRYFAAHHLQGSRCVVLGPADTARYVELAGGRCVPPDAAFDVLVVGDADGFPLLPTLNTVLTALFQKADRGEQVHLLLPNPDLIYPAAAHRFGIASGSLALILEAALDLRYPGRAPRFERLGKPHPALFAEALERSGTRDMVMLGDQMETDIRGAAAFGLHSALVATGIAGPVPAFPPGQPRPTYWVRSLEPA